MKHLRWLLALAVLTPIACKDDKKAEAPKEFAPMPTKGPAGQGAAVGGGAAPAAPAPQPPPPLK